MNIREKSLILVVDDQLVALRGVARLLEKAGYDTAQAATGGEALRLARELKPDLILLDVVLPDIEGTEVCRIIKADEGLVNIHIILLSGIKTESDSQAEGLDVGADGYIVRPIPNRELLARVNAMLRLKGMEKRLAEAANFAQVVLATSPVGIGTFYSDGAMISANDSLLSIVGFSKDSQEINLKKITDLINSELYEKAMRVIQTGTAIRVEFRAFSPSNVEMWLDCNLNTFDTENEPKILLMVNDITDRKKAEIEREELVNELQNALAQVKRLSGLLPICSWCKKIKDEEGYWQEVESYVDKHSEAQFSHSICSDCYKKHYPDLF